MALNSTLLATEIIAQLDGWAPTAFTNKLATAIATAVVNHITTNAELLPVTTDAGIAGAGIITGKVI